MASIVLNGRLVDEKDALVSVMDWGVLYGYGVYETMKAVSGKVIRLNRHLARLREGAEEIRISLPWSDEEMAGMLESALVTNKLSDAYVRLTVTRGVGEPGLRLGGEVKPNIFIIARPLPADIKEKQEKGVEAAISEKHVRCTGDVRCRVKTTNYLMNALAKLEAEEQGVEDLVLLNEKGFVAEFSSANLFIVEAGGLVTPPLGAGILPGITRETVIELARENGIKLREEDVTVERLRAACEVFKTSAVQGVVPVVGLDGKPVGEGKPGDNTRKIQKIFNVEYRQ